jgi:D-alanyl-D-alanine carboxypeptidase
MRSTPTRPSAVLRVRRATRALVLLSCVASSVSCARAPRAESAAAAARADDPALAPLRAALQASLDSIRAAQRWPGATLGVALADGRTLALATGWSDTARKVAMRPTDRLLQGSVGKTYVAAVAMQLVQEGKLSIDDRIEKWLGGEAWFARLPNARAITVRHLMTHTSGLVRYEFQPAVAEVLKREPYRTWTPEERVSYILDKAPPFAAGEGWEYSDTNFIVLGMIIERITGRRYDDELRRRLLDPLGLRNTVAADRPAVPGLANGYAGPKNELGGYDASIVDGPSGPRLAINPQFEWTGGGVASTAEDLARWAKLVYEGRAFDPALLPRVLDGVPARLGQNVRYGLGVIIRTTPLGPAHGHSGFFPGYATEMLYFPDSKVAVAIQVNVTDPYPRGLVGFITGVARRAGEMRE